MRLLAALAALLLLAPPAFAETAVDSSAYAAACQTQALAFVGDAKADTAPALCDCVISQFTDASQADFDLLAKLMLGTVTDADQLAHPNYDDLSAASTEAIKTCIGNGGLGGLIPADDDPGVIEGDLPFVTPDMTAFDATCRASPTFLEWVSNSPQGAEVARDTVCGCLSDEFKLNFQQSTVDILAKTFEGTITDAERDGYLNYATFASRAEDLLRTCLGQVDLE